MPVNLAHAVGLRIVKMLNDIHSVQRKSSKAVEEVQEKELLTA